MKNERVILVVFLILIAIAAFVVFGYISSLKEQINVLSNNTNQIIKRISTLESDKTMNKITALKAENAALKRQLRGLPCDSSGKKAQKQIKERAKKEKAVTGNQGFLIKDIKPAH